MAEGKEPFRRNVTFSPPTIAYLKDIVKTGTHGSDVTAVIRSLVEQGVREAIDKKLIRAREFSD